MTKDEALKMAIEWFDMAEMDINDGAYRMALPIIKACKEALAQSAQEPVISNEQYQDLLYEYCKLKADNERLRVAVQNLIKVKGRHNTEIAYKKLEQAISATPAQKIKDNV